MIQTQRNVAKYLEEKKWYTINSLGIGNKKYIYITKTNYVTSMKTAKFTRFSKPKWY